MNDTLVKEPDGLEEAPYNISNFDGGTAPASADKFMRAGKHRMEHCAWDHYGIIWFHDGKFHERVMRYGSHVETMSAPSLSDLISDVNDKYGAE